MDKAKWTFMVYMAGDNSLDGAALKDLAEMARAGFTNAVNVLVQLDRLNDHKTRRFRITKGGGYNKDCIETFGETDTGDPRVLCDFIKWGVKRYPAVRSSKNGKGIPGKFRDAFSSYFTGRGQESVFYGSRHILDLLGTHGTMASR